MRLTQAPATNQEGNYKKFEIHTNNAAEIL